MLSSGCFSLLFSKNKPKAFDVANSVANEAMHVKVKYSDSLDVTFINTFDVFVLISDDVSLTNEMEQFARYRNYDPIIHKLYYIRSRTFGRIFNNYDKKAISQLHTFRSGNSVPDSVFLVGIKSKSDAPIMKRDVLIELLQSESVAIAKTKAKDLLDTTEICAINVKEFISARPRPHNPVTTEAGSVTIIGKIPLGLLQKNSTEVPVNRK